MAITLPTEKQKPVYDFRKEKILVYGPPGCGKTACFGSIPDVLVIGAEKGQNKLEAFVAPALTWQEFLDIIEELKKTDKFPMVVIDTVDMLWSHYIDHFCKVNKVKHEGEIAFRGYSMIARGFAEAFRDLQTINRGYILLNHTRHDAIDDVKKVVKPNLPEDKDRIIRTSIKGLVDIIFYMEVLDVPGADGNIESRRVIHTSATEQYEAKCRFPMPETIILPKNDPVASARHIAIEYNKAAKAAQTQAEAKRNEKMEEKK